jgi:hypothetical protein
MRVTPVGFLQTAGNLLCTWSRIFFNKKRFRFSFASQRFGTVAQGCHEKQKTPVPKAETARVSSEV